MSGNKVLRSLSVPTVQKESLLKEQLRSTVKNFKNCEDVIICSVVPAVLPKVTSTVKKVLKLQPVIIGKDVVVPMVNRYKNSRQVGQDRLVGAYAAKKLYGVPAIIVDLGTAITLDVVSRRGEYLGGIIVPGIQLSADTLFRRTALLPRIEIHKPSSLIGRDTQTSILSGLFYGYGEMLQGLIRRLQKTVKGRPVILMTGGYSTLMKPYLKSPNAPSIRIVPDLVMQGMALILQER